MQDQRFANPNSKVRPNQRLIVVGNGMVGHKLIDSLIGSEVREHFEILVLGEEPRLAYDRVHLSEYFAGKSAADLALTNEAFYQSNGIDYRLGVKINQLDPVKQQLTSSSGETFAYDKLVLATGSYPFVPPIPGHQRADCLVYRTIEDLQAIEVAGARGRVGVVVGGGLLGLECAKALKDLGLETHVVEFAPHLMGVQLDSEGAALLKETIEELGVQVHTGKNTQKIIDGEQCQHKMCFADGAQLETDLIVFSAGIRPRDELARDAGLEVGPRGGICVNNYCQTSAPNVYAIGECALWQQQVFGLVAPGYQMAQVVAKHLAGLDKAFLGADMSTKLKLLDVEVASIGDCHARTPGSLSYRYFNGVAKQYKKLVVSADQKTLLGAILIGDSQDYGNLLQMVLNGMELPKAPETLILPQTTDASEAPGLGVAALPDSAQICSCHNVTKADICNAVMAGAEDLAALKTATKAATGCGGCAALVGQVLNHQLQQQGIEVNKDLCEHFAYSRQELYHLIRVEQIKDFPTLLERHGRGLGCDICKPTVASILASCWNDYILQQQHSSLQDTNDRYLANMQKDGTYSVVPRVPGGEITPEKLIVLGQVAQKYRLYTKITGGQRVDLFGAKLNQLPNIWRELIEAGFETGHAYGKAVRTVKSCVGSTWCRYGVQDSVGLAIDIENRYKGLRAPHKIKFAVSGCTRECAEAQSKDIGIIATEQGWALYVAGNGGMKPRHADLFATDLDSQTLIKYIDRILMFYVQTADRLQRTASWLDNLEGGLAYLQQVVIDDSLKIAGKLETQMQHVVDQYQCEWKTTLADGQKLKQFRHFVNDEGDDENVVFVQERQQIRPATEEEKHQLLDVSNA